MVIRITGLLQREKNKLFIKKYTQMNELVFKGQNDQVVTTSLKVAEVFGKEHQHILRDIRDLVEGVSRIGDTPMFEETTYIHPQNKQQYPMFLMNRDGFTLLAMGFTGDKALRFKMAYINAFNEMERALREMQPKLPTTYLEALEALVQSERAKQQALLENEKLQLENTEMKREVTHKENVIIGLVGDIDLATKRQRITQIVRKGADGNYRERYQLLYSEFEKKYHVDLSRRMNNCEEMKPKIKNKMDYIDRVMNMTPQLYEGTYN